jgi:hypothetical protein
MDGIGIDVQKWKASQLYILGAGGEHAGWHL